jgi:preprotein translocase subunit SecB
MPTSNALLEVESYYVRELHLKTNFEYEDQKPSTGEVDVDFTVHRHPEELTAFQVVLSVAVALSEQTRCNEPYAISVLLNGFFTFKPDVSEEQMVRMMFSNGVPIMYGLARGCVSQATALGIHGPVTLPTVNFVELAKKKAEASSATPPKEIAAAATEGDGTE